MTTAYTMLATFLMRKYPKVWKAWQAEWKDCKTMKQHDDEEKQ